MNFRTISVTGFEGAVFGARLPMCLNYEEAIKKSDSTIVSNDVFHIGEADLKLLKNLIHEDEKGSGQPNSKYLRMIHVQVVITAPLYWWKEMDTYKIGTTTNSTSTMHKLASTPITKECFEMDDFEDLDTEQGLEALKLVQWSSLLSWLEDLRRTYNETKDKRYWKEIVRLLPESWLQTRMLDCDYATLRNICYWRKNHKLNEWSGKDNYGNENFIRWARTLPYAQDLIFTV